MSLTDKRKRPRRKEGRIRMDRRVGDRRADGVPPAPDTPARHDTGKRQRISDHNVGSSHMSKKSAPKSVSKLHRP
jgi:hypothetical protein